MEIERKFRFNKDSFLRYIKDEKYKTREISQYYIPALDGTFRLRRTRFDDNTYSFVVALKKFVSKGQNEELEVYIDSNVAYEMIAGVKNLSMLRKVRYYIEIDKLFWEVDLFHNGMSLAEVELDSLDQKISLPPFVEEEVTGDKTFSSEFIARNLSGNEFAVNTL